ncbi:MAG: hypothetical protein V7L11_23950 [Nostoc sp.]|uniref:hypothetical protein n=1 Tax=Nostoc sp. TaxID=1180 RepID=UPI002FF9F663
MIGKLRGQFQALLGQTIASLGRVALVQDNEPSPLVDTLLFTLTDRRNFELLVEQDTVQFQELSNINGLFASFELEPGEQLVVYTLEEIVGIRQTVASLTEIWAGEGETEFLVAVSFWDQDKHPIISVCTEGDEAELMSLEKLWQRVDDMIFSYGTLSHYLYTSTKKTKASAERSPIL